MRQSFFMITAICSMSLASTSACGQKPKTSPFQQVEVPTSVLDQLNDFIYKEDKLASARNPMYITNLLATEDKQYKDGVYYFRLMSPHALGRIFIVFKGQATIFKSFETGALMQEYVLFLSKNQLPEKTRINYLKAIAGHLDRQYKSQHE